MQSLPNIKELVRPAFHAVTGLYICIVDIGFSFFVCVLYKILYLTEVFSNLISNMKGLWKTFHTKISNQQLFDIMSCHCDKKTMLIKRAILLGLQ